MVHYSTSRPSPITHSFSKLVIVAGLILGAGQCMWAQNKTWELIDRMYDKYKPLRTDTNYIVRPKEKWTLKISESISQDVLTFKGDNIGFIPYKGELQSKETIKLGMSASYRGLSLSYGVDLTRLGKVSANQALGITSFGNRMGGDITLSRIKNFEGYISPDGTHHELSLDQVKQDKLAVNGYFVFNHKRFSYPAAFTQSYIQKHSSGSFILNGTFMMSRINMYTEDLAAEFVKEINLIHAGIGAGYAYNWIPNRKFLVSLSVLPSLILYKDYKLDYGNRVANMPREPIDIHLTTRCSFIWYFSSYFLGTMVTHNISHVGNKDFSVQNENLTAKVAIGRRF